MDKFLSLLTRDPILITATLFLAATVAILLWALNKFQNNHAVSELENSDDDFNEPPEESQATETSGLAEARLREITTQLAEIDRKVSEIKIAEIVSSIKLKKDADQTMPASMVTKDELEKFTKRIEARLELLAGDKTVGADDNIQKLEAKLEGIHKLLIILTDSGSPDQK